MKSRAKGSRDEGAESVRRGWEKVTRWAGLGDNGRDAAQEGNQDEMVTEMKDGEMQDGMEQESASGSVGRVEAGMEHPLADDEQESAGGFEAELAQVTGERDQLKDRLARLQAEFDNARKREAKERADAREYTIGNTVEPFLGVMDNFQLALKAEGSAEQLRSGVELILKQMEEALKGLQVVPVETTGAQFDPRIHEALGSIETTQSPDGQVLEEIRRGYKVREKLLRPALVRIASNPAQVND